MLEYTCILYVHIDIGTSSELREPIEDTVINSVYDTITDDHCKKSVEEPVNYYEEVKRSLEIKITPNPAYTVA